MYTGYVYDRNFLSPTHTVIYWNNENVSVIQGLRPSKNIKIVTQCKDSTPTLRECRQAGSLLALIWVQTFHLS